MTWPVVGSALVSATTPSGSTTGVTVTADAAANTKGAWAELIAATTHETDLLRVSLIRTAVAASGVDTSSLLDVGVGAAGSEQVLVPNLLVGSKPVATALAMDVPVRIPAGVRVAARLQSASGGKTAEVLATVMGGGMPEITGSIVTAYGITTASSTGTTTAAPAVANTKGAWTQIVAATTAPIRWLLVCMQCRANTQQSAVTATVDIGVGGSGSEKVVVPDIWIETSAAEVVWYVPITVPVDIGIGSRLAVRAQATSTAAGGVFQVAVYGIG